MQLDWRGPLLGVQKGPAPSSKGNFSTRACQKQGVQNIPAQRVTDLEATKRQLRQISCVLDSCTVEVPLSQPCFEHFFRPCFRGHDEASLLAFEALRGSPRPGLGQASDAKRNGTRTKRGSRGLESFHTRQD